ncbi:MAG: hypothetical protein V7K67_27700 [Nostoc sp.]|uniref:hypothetical protein n=1 Tax=Nostoc sp. TaxID=1180 RepID=UPI002FFB377F
MTTASERVDGKLLGLMELVGGKRFPCIGVYLAKIPYREQPDATPKTKAGLAPALPTFRLV